VFEAGYGNVDGLVYQTAAVAMVSFNKDSTLLRLSLPQRSMQMNTQHRHRLFF
jgi:hypothetical protein